MRDLKGHLSNASTLWFTLYAASAAFCTYFCMYAFRKPFAVASFEQAGLVADIDFKTALIISQVFGYALSKFIGIKVISEMTADRRSLAILTLVMMAQVALVAFALLPGNWKLAALFFNGLPLGMIWGLVFSFLEGRRTSEVLGAGLAVSFIVSSGVVKTVGKYLMLEVGISEFWMPAATGAIFTLPLFISVYFLAKIPKPDEQDMLERHKRQPMNAQDRMALVSKYALGLSLMVFSYMLLTGLRDFSDNFAAEIWTALGYGDEPGIFSIAALYTSLIILLMLGMIMWVKQNLRAFMVNHLVVIIGMLTLGLSSLMYQFELLDGAAWMIILSTGIYLAYIPFNCLIFDRMLSLVHDRANAGFLIYIADAMGYAGSVGILLYRSLFDVELSWIHFLLHSAYFIAITGSIMMIGSGVFFYQKFRNSTLQGELNSAASG